MIYIFAGGKATRFNSCKKCLLKIYDETLLDRMIRLSKTYFPEHEISIVSHFPDLLRDGCSRTSFGNTSSVTDAFAYLADKLDGDTILLLGDVYFSEKAFELLKNSNSDINIIERIEFNKYSGKDFGEIYAVKILKTGIEEWNIASKEVNNTYKKKKCAGKIHDINRFLGKEKYRKYICDETEDFDYAIEWQVWKQAMLHKIMPNKTIYRSRKKMKKAQWPKGL